MSFQTIVLIIIGLAVAIGLGSYFLRPEDTTTSTTELSTTVDEADGETVEIEPGDNASEASIPNEPGDSPFEADTESVYTDGTHAVVANYQAPNKANHIVSVSLTLENDVVTASTLAFSGDQVDTSKGFQGKFAAAYEAQIIGKKLDDIKLSRVGGASLTTGAFNDAIAQVKATAVN